MIHPITECEIQKLIDEYYVEKKSNSSSSLSVNRFSIEGFEEANSKDKLSSSRSSLNETFTLTQEMINELVREAKTQMPLFQFKYNTEKFEEPKNEEGSN